MNKIINGGFLLLSLVVNAQFGRIYMNAPRGSGALAVTYSNTGSNTSWDETISNQEVVRAAKDAQIHEAIAAGRTEVAGKRTPWHISIRQAAGGARRRLRNRLRGLR